MGTGNSSSYHSSNDWASTVGLGILDQLPLEILSCIVLSLDISAIDHIKAMNRRSFELVNNHPQFKIINLQAHDTLRGLRAIKTDHMITVQTLFEKLCTGQCSECGDYGGYIYLVTFERAVADVSQTKTGTCRYKRLTL